MAHEAPVEKQRGQVYEALLKTHGSAFPLSDVRFASHSFKQVLFNDSIELIRKAFVHTRRHPTIYSVYKEKRNCEIVFHRSCQFTLHYKQLNFKSGILRLEQLNFNDFTHIIPNHHIA